MLKAMQFSFTVHQCTRVLNSRDHWPDHRLKTISTPALNTPHRTQAPDLLQGRRLQLVTLLPCGDGQCLRAKFCLHLFVIYVDAHRI